MSILDSQDELAKKIEDKMVLKHYMSIQIEPPAATVADPFDKYFSTPIETVVNKILSIPITVEWMDAYKHYRYSYMQEFNQKHTVPQLLQFLMSNCPMKSCVHASGYYPTIIGWDDMYVFFQCKNGVEIWATFFDRYTAKTIHQITFTLYHYEHT